MLSFVWRLIVSYSFQILPIQEQFNVLLLLIHYCRRIVCVISRWRFSCLIILPLIVRWWFVVLISLTCILFWIYCFRLLQNISQGRSMNFWRAFWAGFTRALSSAYVRFEFNFPSMENPDRQYDSNFHYIVAISIQNSRAERTYPCFPLFSILTDPVIPLSVFIFAAFVCDNIN